MTSNTTTDNDTSVDRHFDLINSEEDDEEQSSVSPSYSTDDCPSTPINAVETFDDEKMNKLYDDWFAFDADLRTFEPKHKEYVRKLDEVESLKSKYKNEFDKYKKKINQLQKDVARLRKSYEKKG
jgi:hypothetical protein